MADVIRSFEIPNRVPGKLVFGPKRTLATFGSTETSTPATLPPVLCPPSAPGGFGDAQSAAGIHISVNVVKEINDNTDGLADSNPAPGVSKEIDAGPGDAPSDPGIATSILSDCDFPFQEGVAQSINDPATTSHIISLPATIAAGETLIGIIAFDAGTGGLTWPAGWVELIDKSGSASTDSLGVAWKKATGGEGATITVTSVGSTESAATVFRISNAQDPTVIPPDVTGTAFGSSAAPNPGLLTPTQFGQSAAFLFIAFYAGNGAGPTTGCPSGYGNDQSHANGTHCHIGVCDKLELKTGTENPGAFSKTGSAHWTAGALVVYPA